MCRIEIYEEPERPHDDSEEGVMLKQIFGAERKMPKGAYWKSGLKWEWCGHCECPSTAYACCNNSLCNAGGCEVCCAPDGAAEQAHIVLSSHHDEIVEALRYIQGMMTPLERVAFETDLKRKGSPILSGG